MARGRGGRNSGNATPETRRKVAQARKLAPKHTSLESLAKAVGSSASTLSKHGVSALGGMTDVGRMHVNNGGSPGLTLDEPGAAIYDIEGYERDGFNTDTGPAGDLKTTALKHREPHRHQQESVPISEARLLRGKAADAWRDHKRDMKDLETFGSEDASMKEAMGRAAQKSLNKANRLEGDAEHAEYKAEESCELGRAQVAYFNDFLSTEEDPNNEALNLWVSKVNYVPYGTEDVEAYRKHRVADAIDSVMNRSDVRNQGQIEAYAAVRELLQDPVSSPAAREAMDAPRQHHSDGESDGARWDFFKPVIEEMTR